MTGSVLSPMKATYFGDTVGKVYRITSVFAGVCTCDEESDCSQAATITGNTGCAEVLKWQNLSC